MWKKVNVVFRLKSPLHIGYLPFKGSVVSPTRYYVPGRNLWGAITKRATEHICENPTADDYKNIGKEVIKNFRFSYFYLYDGRTIYFPRYTDEGLKYGDITKTEFEHKFIASFISTEINSGGTAKDKSLHEIEFINNRFRDEKGDLKGVKIAGFIWVEEDTKIDGEGIVLNDKGIVIKDFNVIKELILGGESKYGFGHVILDSIKIIDGKTKTVEVKINKDITLISHLRYDKDIKFEGDMELSTGRGYFYPDIENSQDHPGAVIDEPKYFLTPGSIILDEIETEMLWDGTLSKKH
ncbi:MAG: hypothetical protein DRP50_01560 [Thermotoga sp.]|nr:MAG: hypothetical protein DRP50_01560 [Thermotoga sp.]